MNKETSEIRELKRHYCVYPDCTSSYSDSVSTGHLTKHLKEKHGMKIDSCNIRQTIREKATVVQQNTLKRLMTLFIVSSGNFYHRFISKAIFIKFLIKFEGLAFSVVESQEFINMLDFLSEANCEFEIPKRRTIAAQVTKIAAEKRVEIKSKLDIPKKIALTTDVWTSMKQKIAYLGITAHFLQDFKLQSVCLCVKKISGSHSGEALAESIHQTISSFNIVEKIITITTDNGANIVKACDILNSDKYAGLHFKRIPCFAHLLNLIVKSSLANLGFGSKKVSTESNDNLEDEIEDAVDQNRASNSTTQNTEINENSLFMSKC